MSNYVPGSKELQELVKSYLKEITKAGCWLPDHSKEDNGYVRIIVFGKRVFLHRLSLIAFKKLNRKKPLACHEIFCVRKDCFNPEHLYWGNNSDNVLDTSTIGNHGEGKKTHCPKGHLLDGFRGNNKRYCLTCNRLRFPAKQRRKRV